MHISGIARALRTRVGCSRPEKCRHRVIEWESDRVIDWWRTHGECCFVLLTQGWGRLETRPQVFLGSPELSAFTLSLAPPFHPSPIPLTETENLKNVVQFQQGHAHGQFGILGEVLCWKCFPTKRQDWWHSTPTTPTFYKASILLNHHTHSTDPIRNKKSNAFDTNMASPSRQHNFTLRVSHKCIVTVAEFGRSRQRRRWNSPGFPSLGASTIVFGRSRWVWALLDGDDLYLYAYVCWVVSIIRHSGFYAKPRARTHGLDLAETGSGLVEAGCCDTSQHRWQSLNEDWAFMVDSWPHAH